MINLERIETGDISGLDGQELAFMANLSMNRESIFVNQCSGLPSLDDKIVHEFLAELREPTFSLRELDEQELDIIKEAESSSKTPSTQATTRQHVERFKAFLTEKNLSDSIDSMSVRYLDSYLRLWYVSLRRTAESGTTQYAPDTIRGFRASIHRYMVARRGIDVIGNEGFRLSNETYACVLRLSCQGRERVAGQQPGYVAIEEADLALLRNYFNRKDRERLQDEVFFNIVYHFGFRGREWIRNLKVASLQLTEHNGIKCFDFVQAGPEKTLTAATADKFSTSKQIRMFAAENAQCPVATIQLYLSKFPPGVDVLFPKPIKIRPQSEFWYSPSAVVGKNTLNDKMKTISQRAGLGREYTNHCIRATVVTNLVERGHTVQEIKCVTGKIELNTKRISEKRKLELSHSLTATLNSVSESHPSTSESASSINPSSISPTQGKKPTVILEKNGARLTVFL